MAIAKTPAMGTQSTQMTPKGTGNAPTRQIGIPKMAPTPTRPSPGTKIKPTTPPKQYITPIRPGTPKPIRPMPAPKTPNPKTPTPLQNKAAIDKMVRKGM